MKFGINRYIGDWLSGDGLRLRIDKVSDRFADLDEEVLSPSLSRHEEDHFLDAAYPMFGNLQDYKRTGTQNQAIHAIGAAAPMLTSNVQ